MGLQMNPRMTPTRNSSTAGQMSPIAFTAKTNTTAHPTTAQAVTA